MMKNMSTDQKYIASGIGLVAVGGIMSGITKSSTWFAVGSLLAAGGLGYRLMTKDNSPEVTTMSNPDSDELPYALDIADYRHNWLKRRDNSVARAVSVDPMDAWLRSAPVSLEAVYGGKLYR